MAVPWGKYNFNPLGSDHLLLAALPYGLCVNTSCPSARHTSQIGRTVLNFLVNVTALKALAEAQ